MVHGRQCYRAGTIGAGGTVEVSSPEDTQLGRSVAREKYQEKNGHNLATYEKAAVKGFLSSLWFFGPECFRRIVLVTYSSSSFGRPTILFRRSGRPLTQLGFFSIQGKFPD